MRYFPGFGAVALFLMAAMTAMAQDAAPRPAVVVAPAEERALAQSARFNGRLDADQRVAIVARVSGTLLEVAFQPGDMVEAGQLLYRIEPDLFAASLQDAEGALRAAQAARDLAQIDRDRQAELVSRDAAPQAALDTAEANLGQAEGALIRAEAAVSAAQLNLSYTEVTAPFSGRIGTSATDVGALVGPETGRMATLVSLDPIHAEFPVPTAIYRSFIEAVEAGETSTEAAVSLELANGTVYAEAGSVDFVDSAINPGTDSVTVRAAFPNPDGNLLDDELVRVELRASEATPELAVPQQAVQRDIQGTFVLVVGADDVVESRRVTVGRTTEGFATVEAGLEAGERVITEGINKVRPGIAVDAAPAGDG